MTGHIYLDIIVEQFVPFCKGSMGAEFVFMDGNARPYRANIVNEWLDSQNITCMKEFKEMYSKLDEEEQKELKDCLNKVLEIVLSEIGEIPEECEGKTGEWMDYLTE
ncbi:hypothetical protein NPIL_359931 [Nephila pilipes]|uniref:Uncharacterized protein n=1 Tax=Nephila pilipes TaxID=299642 RepID=A0A8X6NJ76_NEPPI|nr:hypothetical protein NPIL_359931 [Nephila pilipes]